VSEQSSSRPKFSQSEDDLVLQRVEVPKIRKDLVDPPQPPAETSLTEEPPMSPVTARNPHEDSQDKKGGGQTSGDPDEPVIDPMDGMGDSADTPMLLTEIDHIAIAVDDLGEAIDYYRETFGAVVDHREVVESDGVEEALLKVAESYIQLLTRPVTTRPWPSTSPTRARASTTSATESTTAPPRSTV